MLDVRRLRLLREVARRGSIAAAADALSFTPSAVSQQLAKLEREAGVALLERGPRSVRLTAAGDLLAEHAGAILERLALAERELQALAERERRSLRVGSFPTAAATIVPPALAGVSRRFPGAEIVVLGMDPLAALDRLEGGGLDAAVVFEYDHVPLPALSGVELELLVEEPLRVLLPRAHPRAGRRSVPLRELAGETWIKPTPRSSCHEFTGRACRAAGFEPRIGFEFDDYQALQELVAAGVGVGFAPEMALGTMHPDVVARTVGFGQPRRRIYAATAAAEPSPLVESFLEGLRAHVRTARAAVPRARLRARR